MIAEVFSQTSKVTDEGGRVLQNATLKGFSGMFEISVRHPESSEVHSRFTKTCQFNLSEYIRKNACTAAGQVFH